MGSRSGLATLPSCLSPGDPACGLILGVLGLLITPVRITAVGDGCQTMDSVPHSCFSVFSLAMGRMTKRFERKSPLKFSEQTDLGFHIYHTGLSHLSLHQMKWSQMFWGAGSSQGRFVVGTVFPGLEDCGNGVWDLPGSPVVNNLIPGWGTKIPRVKGNCCV